MENCPSHENLVKEVQDMRVDMARVDERLQNIPGQIKSSIMEAFQEQRKNDQNETENCKPEPEPAHKTWSTPVLLAVIGVFSMVFQKTLDLLGVLFAFFTHSGAVQAVDTVSKVVDK